jgi:hypothetical protein
MSAVAFLFLLQSIAASPAPPPSFGPADEIRNGLERANRGVERAEACAGVRRNYSDRIEQFRKRFTDVLNRAQTLYGTSVAPLLGNIVINVPCSRANRRRYFAEIEQGLERAEKALLLRLAEMRGLWVGEIQLCRISVEEIALVEDRDGSKVPVIRLTPRFHNLIRAETESRVGKPFGLYLDGRLIAAPTVMEPISAEMQISGPLDARDLQQMREAAALPC